MPGPKEASRQQFNHYLKPLVDELLQLYTGVPMQTSTTEVAVVRAALLLVACDIRYKKENVILVDIMSA